MLECTWRRRRTHCSRSDIPSLNVMVDTPRGTVQLLFYMGCPDSQPISLSQGFAPCHTAVQHWRHCGACAGHEAAAAQKLGKLMLDLARSPEAGWASSRSCRSRSYLRLDRERRLHESRVNGHRNGTIKFLF